jgi:hypothetical protein
VVRHRRGGQLFRLSSKSHWDIPVEPAQRRIGVTCSRATPRPRRSTGTEARNKKRNHDEIRFWADYIDNASYILDDAASTRRAARPPHFVIVGDLNADPDEGFLEQPDRRTCCSEQPARCAETPPRPARSPSTGLDATTPPGSACASTTSCPPSTLTVLGSGVWRYPPAGAAFPSDHFPVWADIVVPPKP